MVLVTVAFCIEQQQWTHAFDVERGSTVRQLKEQMLGPKGTPEDVDAFELRLLGRRVPDAERLHQDHTLDFAHLGPEEGRRRARSDARELEAWQEHGRQRAQEVSRPPGTIAAAAPAPEHEEGRPTPAAALPEEQEAQPRAFYQAAPRRPPAAPAPLLAQRWEVVGGVDKGGILVREGQSLASKQLARRLVTGSLVEELRVEGERLNYRMVRGEGPETGWVSLTLSGRELLVRRAPEPEELLTLDRAVALQGDLMEAFARPDFQRALDELHREHPDKKGLQFVKRRNELFLTVQSVVLPKYGFEGSPAGVLRMMAAFKPHAAEEVVWNNAQLNSLLRI